MTVRDKLWLFASCAHDDDPSLGKSPTHQRYLKKSRITPAEGCFMLDIPNIIMVGSSGGEPVPFSYDALGYAESFCRLDRVLWSVTGSGGFRSGNEEVFICDMAKKYPNVMGGFADDLFFNDDLGGIEDEELLKELTEKKAKNQAILNSVTSTFKEACRPMELWATVYISNAEARLWDENPEFWNSFTGLSLWTWEMKDLPMLEANFKTVKRAFPDKKLYLGVYIYDYMSGEPIPNNLMEHQCEFGLKMLKEKQIDGMIFLTNCVMGIGLPSEYWLRDWIEKNKNTELGE